MKKKLYWGVTLVVSAGLTAASVQAEDWPSWRGARQNGVSGETGLIESWSPEGENLIWRQDFTGRSTPVVMEGRVYVNGRVGTDIDRQAVVAAFDAENGARLWQRRLPIYLSTVPYNRIGWASMTGDPETGNLYVQLASGAFYCLDRDGATVWQRSFKEEFGRFEGYGGRTASPLIDEDRVIVNMINGTWGDQGPPFHRFYALDKRNGEVVWMAGGNQVVADRNTQSSPVLAVIGGQRLIIGGGADGRVYALQSRTGKLVWQFDLSKRGVNVSPVVDGDVVYIGHSEENVDEGTLGRVVAIDGTGSGDVTATHELWRSNEHRVGFPSPLVHNGRVYLVDNSGNLAALDAGTGEEKWQVSLGTVGKGSPVWADGKIYATETNGHLVIIEPGEDSAVILDRDQVQVPGGRYAELYGSVAVAYGRIYFTSEAGIYCLGDKSASFAVSAAPPVPLAAESSQRGPAAHLLVVPGELALRSGDEVALEVYAFDARGAALGTVDGEWALRDLQVDLSGGKLRVPADSGVQAGVAIVTSGGLEAMARVRVFPPLPWAENFDSIEPGGRRSHWMGASRYQVEAAESGNVLVKPVAARGLLRSNLFIGPAWLSEYTIQADVKLTQKGRRRSDGGLINSGYTLDLMGTHQRIQLRSWATVLRIKEEVDFELEMDTWYTVKLRVEKDGEKAIARAKVWARGEEEPQDWTLSATDPFPIRRGAPGLQAYSPANFYFDNVRVTGN